MPHKRLLKGEKDNIQPIKEVAHSTKKRTAIFYGRVSSGTQAKEDSGGLDRQKFAGLEWEKKSHHDCEIDWDKSRFVAESGAKAGRLQFFIDMVKNGEIPRDSVLVASGDSCSEWK